MWASGHNVNGYTITKALGQGVSSTVYLTSKDNINYALKAIPLNKPWKVQDYQREIRSLNKCKDCPFVVRYIESFEYKNFGIQIQEFMLGDLLDYSNARDLTLQQKRIIFMQICLGVQFLHSHQMAHLDLKPENIFLNDVNSVKLGDLGSCNKLNESDHVGIVGTNFYIAPEIVIFFVNFSLNNNQLIYLFFSIPKKMVMICIKQIYG